jgi:formylglycine-generating enzyme required for sulfatase activity
MSKHKRPTDESVLPDPALSWQKGEAPSWASGWGEDAFGAHADFSVGDVIQRLRWIPPGRFWMGSPEDEEGRYGWEGPRHEVTLGFGFWMMDAPVRQSLWRAVMRRNPSSFKSQNRPVERVDWPMIQEFLSRLNDRVPGLELALPSEAQWEYACRAGSDASIYAEDLDQMAWYEDNSQHETRPVGEKLANAFGLHDMLGNVWEWCADHWRGDYDGAPTDGSAWVNEDPAANRVVRGGSWRSPARLVRASSRLGVGPALRDVLLGFRCIGVQG